MKTPFILNNSRKMRIAKGSGATILAVNGLLKKFTEMKSMMKKMNNPAKMKKMLSQLGGGNDMDMGGLENMLKTNQSI